MFNISIFFFFFFFNAPATTEIYTLSLHDALPIFYTMSVSAVLVLRRKMPQAARPYSMWGYPITLWAFLAVSVGFMVNEVVAEPWPSFMAFVIVATGVPAYGCWRRPVSFLPTNLH